MQLLGGTKRSHALRRCINLWPPFLGAGIRVEHIAADMKSIDVLMKFRFWNAVEVKDERGVVIAEVEKVLPVRKKPVAV
jgi:hypothetical protein